LRTSYSENWPRLTWPETRATLHHYRDRDQYEVDAVLEDAAGRVVGIEVKAAETVRGDGFRGLRFLQRRLGDRFHAGFVLYCGTESLSFGDRLAACRCPRCGPSHPNHEHVPRWLNRSGFVGGSDPSPATHANAFCGNTAHGASNGPR
jgi:predicted AAA+ superfamily ATPase